MSFGIGDTVGTYKIVGAIGAGGMGEVFRVEHVVTKRVEAMKILAAATSTSSEQDQRFLREIQVQASLSHPNIAAVHNAFWEDKHLVMIMELIEGASLRTLLEGGRIPLASAIDYACQALAALDYAHSHGVVHRDISPANMIITEDGTLKLTDFGLAKSLKDIRLTQTGALVGSLVVGIVVEMSTLWIPAELKYVGALAILIVILLVRPQGILGRAQRVG